MTDGVTDGAAALDPGTTGASAAPERTDGPDLSALNVLVVDDEADIRLGLRRLLARLGIKAREASCGADAVRMLEEHDADLVLSDLMMPGMTGAELLQVVKQRRPETMVVILTGYGTVATAVSCLQDGAAHFLTKPFDNDEILRLVHRLGSQVLAGRRGNETGEEVIAEDPRMRRVLQLIERVAPSPAPILVEGESGTGKEVVARQIHRCSDVAERPFQAVNCAALPDALLESELFGHVRGSFTGADRDRQGLFAEAQGGTVFLDEVSSMSPAFQGKLLRVLQEKVVRPVGGSRDRAVDFRLVAATNRDLSEMVSEGAFREDLFYRLNVVRVHLPPLRERPQDVLPLALHFLRRAAETCLGPAAPVPELSEAATAALVEHRWPGNVRELENAVQRAVIVCSGERVLPYHLDLGEREWADDDPDYGTAKRRTLERFQRQFVQRALERTGGNVSQAAESCGMTRVALQKIMRQLGIERATFAR